MTITNCQSTTDQNFDKCSQPTIVRDAPDYTYPTVMPSQGGTVAGKLTAAPGTVSGLTDFPNPQNLYNGTILPPALYLKPGDKIDLTVVNQMDTSTWTPPATAGTPPHGTNVHYHGLNIPPNNFDGQTPTDSVFINIAEGASNGYEYEFPIPSTHPVGSFWYHPHPHGFTEPQLLGGMSGVMVIRGLLETYYPEVANILGPTAPENGGTAYENTLEKLFLLKDYVPRGQTCAVKSVNGVLTGTIEATSNQPELWRLANAGANQFFNLQVQGAGDTVQTFYIIAVDGNPTTNANGVAAPMPAQKLPIPPGSRMDVLIQLPPGQYTLMDLGTYTGTRGDPNCPTTLGSINASNGPATPSLNLSQLTSTVPVQRPTLNALKNMPKCQPGAVSVQFTEIPSFSINGKTYDMTKVDTTVTVPDTSDTPCVSEWTITNQGAEHHVFHIHQVDFIVESPPPSGDGVFSANPGYQDTITIPMGQSAKVLIPFDSSIAGYFVYHCHILNHEDIGMMANICVGTSEGDQQCQGTTPAARQPQAHHRH